MKGTLDEKEAHPSAHDAFAFVKKWIVREGMPGVTIMLESMASCAISGNRSGEICGETLRRVIAGEGVSDRYILGLAWFLRNADAQSKPR